jgi:hypothetical protein
MTPDEYCQQKASTDFTSKAFLRDATDSVLTAFVSV